MYSQKSLRCLGIVILLGLSSMLYGQIFNIERKRIPSDTVGWLGSANMRFAGSKSTKSTIALSAGTALEYKSRSTRSLWLFVTDFSLVTGDKEKFSDNGFGHFLYNYKLGNTIRWEIFTQLQYNSLTKLQRQALVGTGPRFKLTQYENAKFYWGIAYVYEYEEVSDSTMLHRDHRGSSYFTFTLTPEETVTFSSTTYVQPLLTDLGDFRISNETNLTLDISRKLTFIASLKYFYDSRPPFEVPKNIYSFSNGLELIF